jgi:hypothetical protein
LLAKVVEEENVPVALPTETCRYFAEPARRP